MKHKELAKQAGFDFDDYYDSVTQEELERFAELVRQDERAKCASDYLQDCCDAIAVAEHNEREACAELATQKAKHIFDHAEIYAVGASETANAQATAWQLKVLADEIRARGNK
ncbi:hypothetical protein UFOVP172_31 [uncultured Caudovirales phage]|uniref:Uncharacterized protein n=1 Tax=uncultured Caudovirales phage TaxID=2100421 RepID=A0A6J7WCF1_9CAUD|nr:hypothetical protein UFOVP172_31 [uncultured Caudovirales phage]